MDKDSNGQRKLYDSGSLEYHRNRIDHHHHHQYCCCYSTNGIRVIMTIIYHYSGGTDNNEGNLEHVKPI